MNIQAIKMNDINTTTPTTTVPATQASTKAPVDSVSFKAKGPKKDKVAEFFAKIYGKHIINSDKLRNFSEWLHKKTPDGELVTQHLQTLGSIITSSVYMKKTLDNKSLDKDRRKTLAWNQGLVLGVSTLGAYTLSNVMREMNKHLEYEYVAREQKKMAQLGKIDTAKLNEMKDVFSKRLRGFRTLIPILTFTLIYRFVSPVAITPIANAISDWASKKKPNKPEVTSKNA